MFTVGVWLEGKYNENPKTPQNPVSIPVHEYFIASLNGSC